MSRQRRAGAQWRVLVHDHLGRGRYGTAHHITSDRRLGALPGTQGLGGSEHERVIELPGTEFDELVVGRFLHVENMGDCYWLNIAGVVITVVADRDGRPLRVRVTGPGDDDEPVPGCRYRLFWPAEDDFTAPRTQP